MALKRGNNVFGHGAIHAVFGQEIAKGREVALQRIDRQPLISSAYHRSRLDWHGWDPVSNPGRREVNPWKPFARVDLAPGRDVGMGENAALGDSVARANIAA